MWFYNFWDIISTITESFSLLVIIDCFCQTPQIQRNINRIIWPAAYAAVVIWLTFFTDLGALKMFIGMSIIVAILKFAYRFTFHESLIIMEVSFVVMSMFPEALVVSLMSFICNGDITNTIGNVLILKWQLYVLTILVRCICLAVVYYLLHNFHYRLQRKDAFVLTIGFLLTFCVSFTSAYNYLNLQLEDTLILDLVTTVLCMYFIVQFLYTKNVSYLREQEQKDKMQIAQLNRQFDYYREKLKDEERVRSVYHDMKNHLLVLQQQIHSPETTTMVENLKSQVVMYENYTHTGNDFLDIILKDKAEKAREKKIDLSVSVNLNGVDFIEPLDISTIFGNGLDNAIEASEKLPEEQRAILVKAGRIQNFFSLMIENNCLPEDESVKNHSTDQDDFFHGFGIPNMKKSAEKYRGQLTTKCENGHFTLKILVPVP